MMQLVENKNMWRIYMEKSNIEKSFDIVKNPKHYNTGTYQCIDVMLDIFGKDKTAAFCELNAFKYLWRANNKGTDIQDKKKAEWYLNKYIELKENKDE